MPRMHTLLRVSPARTFLCLFAAVLLWSGCQKPQAAFKPDPAFTPYVRAFTAGYISARSPILVRIAEDQRWKDTTEAALQQLFRLEPAVKGKVQLSDPRTLVFTPEQRLEQDQLYTVRFALGRAIEVPAGMEEFKFPVNTLRQNLALRITEMQALSTNDAAWQRLLVSAYTGDDATGQDLEGAVQATQGKRALPITWEHEPNGRSHRFTVDSVQRGSGVAEVVIAWNGKPIGIKEKGEERFTVPGIGELKLISESTSSDGEQQATLVFSDPLDPAQDLAGLVGIAGADEVRPVVEGSRLILQVKRRITGEQSAYVSGALRAANGNKLGSDVTVDLLFEELKPAVRLVGKGVILPSSDGLLMPFEAVNLSAVDVRVVRIHESNVAQFLQVNALNGEREIARVGRLVSRSTVELRTADAPDPGRWNRYYLDLADLFKSEPGAIYRVELNFRREHSLYPCAGTTEVGPSRERTWEEEQADYDSFQDYWYYDYGYYDDEYYEDEWYDGQRPDRGDPCGAAYYAQRRSVSRNLLASDLGLIAKRGNDGSLVLAVSDLPNAQPLSGVEFSVLDLQRNTMAKATSDQQGLASIPSTKHKPFLLVASKGTQRGYLKLDDGSSLSISEFDVEGTAVDKGLKGFIYGERGVWRPGDPIHLTFMLHDPAKSIPADHPVVLELSDPRGRLDQKLVLNSSVNGIYAFRCSTGVDAPTGIWNARVVVGGTSFSKALRIETVKPNRLKMDLKLPTDGTGTPDERLVLRDGAMVDLSSKWLHGAPARDLNARVTMTLSAGRARFKGYEKFEFNDLRNWVPEDEQVSFDGALDAQGVVRFPLKVNVGRNPPAVVNASLVTRVFEAGGDASMDQVSLPCYPYSNYVGVQPPKSRNAWGSLRTDTTYKLEVATLDPLGKPVAGRELQVQVYRMKYNWWWDGRMSGNSNYITSPSIELRSEATITSDSKGRAQFNFRVDRPDWGRFAVRITDPASGHTAALQLYLDWPGWEGRSRREGPDQAAMLNFNSDKEKYATGEQATLIIPSAGTGRALVSIENGSRVISAKWVELKEGETKYTFPITPEMVPNVYAHVSVVQPHASTPNDLPIRLYGVVPLLVEDPNTRLAPRISMPNELRTDEAFQVEVSEQDGKAMTYTLAIVDEGLLDLTRFKTPDPWTHFHAREALGVRTWDLYDQVMGSFGRQVQRILALGGSDDAVKGDAARANRFKPVVRFVGPFTLEKGRKASHSFTISNYVGSVRAMVVASDGVRAYGNAEQAAPVRKPLMVLATLPRVLAPGEVVDLPVTVFAMDNKVKDVVVKVEPNGLLIPEGPAQRTIRFNSMGDQVTTFRMRVKEAVGVAKLKVSVSGGGEQASEQLELQVRQSNLPRTDVEEFVLEGGRSWSSVPMPLGIAGTNSAYLEVSSIPPVDMTRRLRYLIDYPHGCLEQTTSKAFPQLYLANVMELPESTVTELRNNVQGGIHALGAFLRNDGSFNYWPGGDHYDGWTSIYAGHFLVEAERLGYAVPSHLKSSWLAFQKKAAREWTNSARDGWTYEASQLTQAYRLYVLACAGHSDLPAMNRLRERNGLGLQTRWTLAAAYAKAGRQDAARELVKGLDTSVPPYREQAYTYGSNLRDEALIAEALMLMNETARATAVVQRIAQRLSAEGWYSTQSTAFGLMAVARVAEGSKLGKGLSYTLSVNGKAGDRFSSKAISRTDLPVPDGKGELGITNKGENLLYVRLVRTGTPRAGEERAMSNGLYLSVDYMLNDGTPLDPERITQGTDFLAVVRVQHPGTADAYQQLALSQIFPSGWEIRNTRMEGNESGVSRSPYTYQDIRDDRVLTYFNLYKGRTHTYVVKLNAAYIGRYYLPGAHCEAMYDNTVNAAESGQWVEVVKPGAGAL